MLLRIREYLRRQKVVSNQQIAREFNLDILALQPMLDFWLQKGQIVQCEQPTACQSRCFKCKTQITSYYQYVV